MRRRLRTLGVTRVPRGPQPATLRNAAGLTARQAEILNLLAAGLSNAQIAERLVVSTRTRRQKVVREDSGSAVDRGPG